MTNAVTAKRSDATAVSLEPSFKRIRGWLRRVWSEPLCGLHAEGTPRILPTCFAVLASECCGSLPEVDEAQKQAAAEAILQSQNGDDGFFYDGRVRTADTSFRPRYLNMQHTYFALHALDALDHKPRFPVAFADSLSSPEYLRGWLDGGPWDNPWLHSNNVMFAFSFLLHEHGRTDEDKYLWAFDAILDYLDERQDPESGLWQPEGGRDDRNAVFAAYHFFPFYFWRGRPLRHVERIIDTTLGIQANDGFYKPFGGACEDLDAVHTLVMLTSVSGYRKQDVQASLARYAKAVMSSQQPDGGFRNINIERPSLLKRTAKNLLHTTKADRLLLNRSLSQEGIWSYSAWKPLTCPLLASDTWSAWFRPLSLRLIAETYPQDYLDAPSGRYRGIPGLGWHDPSRILATVSG